MDADCLCACGDFGSVVSNHRASFHDMQCLLTSFRGITYQRVFEFARAQSSVRLVPSVCKRFGGYLQASLPEGIQH